MRVTVRVSVISGVLLALCAPGGEACLSNGFCAAGEYCAKSEWDCFGVGSCLPRPVSCSILYAPVCGCDGETYGNSCWAARAGVNVVYQGVCNCTDSSQCEAGSFCNRYAGCDGAGLCATLPSSCPGDWDPVCGCDGVTYDTLCHAAMAGVSIDYWGECSTPCSEDTDCPPASYCQKDIGDCSGDGACRTVPGSCPPLFDPVCGCNGVGYSNECWAAASSSSVWYEATCGTSCTGNAECSALEHCDRIGGVCSGSGTCRTMPTLCLTLWTPVCGCDGETYSNSCYSAAAGVTVKHAKPCPVFNDGFEIGDSSRWSTTVS